MKIRFLGATQEVTGSRYLIEHNQTKVLVDCGLFQGTREIRTHNWDNFPIDPHTIDAIVLTHAHLDHTGYIPVLIKHGFEGKIYCSKPTYELTEILLKDSGTIQQEDAAKANKYGYSRHTPALPLYTAKDAQNAMRFFQTVDYDTTFDVGNLKIKLIQSGHILGASFVVVSDGQRTITFSGDLGRPNQPIMKSPPPITQTGFLVLESTYGDRLHEQEDPIEQLGKIIQKTLAQHGVVIIPSFAVGRTQTILYCLYQLLEKKIIPHIPIFLDSPMAINVTELFTIFKDEHKLSEDLCNKVFSIAINTPTVEESKRINSLQGSAIIIAGSGMADGGRVLEHLAHFISDARNTVIFVGFQANGTNGRDLIDGAKQIKIYGKMYEVRASIEIIHNLSAHADYHEILQWLSFFTSKPKKVFLTHGELEPSKALQSKIEERFGWPVVIPKFLETFDLD